MNNKSLGLTLKEIRKSKGLSQKDVIGNLISQSNYSRFENGEIEVSASVFINILKILDISLEEFLLFHKEEDLKNKIIMEFFELNYNDGVKLKKLLDKIEIYINQNRDVYIEMIQKICLSLFSLFKESDLDKAKVGLSEVWKELSKRNQLFIADIHLLNSILFYFPLETAESIKTFLDRQIAYYKNNRELANLQLNISINFSLLLIKEKKYSEALKFIDESLINSKKLRDILKLGICYVRKGIIMSHLSKESSVTDSLINKGLMFLEEIDASGIIEVLNKEINTHKKSLVSR